MQSRTSNKVPYRVTHGHPGRRTTPIDLRVKRLLYR
jgi:hypothetical protein